MDLGQLLASAENGGYLVRVYRNGMSLQKNGQMVFSGPYGSLGGIRFQMAHVSVNGIPMPSVCFFVLRTEDGQRTEITTRNKELSSALEAAYEASAPQLTQKVASRLNAGEEVDFGAVKLSRERIKFQKRGRWIDLGLNDLSGFCVTNGYFLADQGEAPCRLVCETMVRNVENVVALLAMLRQLRPSADLGVPANDEAQRKRISALPWGPASASTRIPGTMTGRGRVMLLGAPVALALLYVLICLPMALVNLSNHKAEEEQLQRVMALSEQALKTLPAQTAELKQACAGKLAEGDLITYFPELADEYKSKIYSYSQDIPHRAVVAKTPWDSLKVEDLGNFHRPPELSDELMEMLNHSPAWKAKTQFALEPVRFLAAARFDQLGFKPSEYGGSEQPSTAVMSVAVLSWPSGETVCSGMVKGAVDARVKSYGPSAAAQLPLNGLCLSGSESLCKAVAEYVE